MDAEEHGPLQPLSPYMPYIHKKTGVRMAVIVMCALSMLGSLLIILSYLCFRSLRTRAREFLLHISIMDFGVAAANLIGAAVYFDKFYRHANCISPSLIVQPFICPVSATTKNLCVAQAFFATYFTYGSILWTICLSVYLYFLIVHHGTKYARRTVWFSYVFCYFLPLLLTLWLLLHSKLGYAPYDSAGWCGLIVKDPLTGEPDVYVALIGYDLWIYLTIVLVPILSISTHMYIRHELKNSEPFFNSGRFWQALQNVDYKFLLIPVAFVILRMWSCIITILFDYAGLRPRSLSKELSMTLIILSGLGDSGQGFTNAILFVVFSRGVRRKFLFWRHNETVTEDNDRQTIVYNPKPGKVQWDTGTTHSLEQTPTTVDSW